MHHSREALHSVRPLHLPEAALHVQALRTRSSGGSQGSPQEQGIATEQARPYAQASDLPFRAPVGLGPGTYGLEVRHHPSGWCVDVTAGP
jgi:hypothetical protein